MTIDLRRLWVAAKADAMADRVADGKLTIEAGYWLVRVHLRAPLMPAMIERRDWEPGDPSNRMDRSYWAAEIAGEECDPADVYRCAERQPISKAEHDFRLADRAWAIEHAPEDAAAAHPRRRVDLTKIGPIEP